MNMALLHSCVRRDRSCITFGVTQWSYCWKLYMYSSRTNHCYWESDRTCTQREGALYLLFQRYLACMILSPWRIGHLLARTDIFRFPILHVAAADGGSIDTWNRELRRPDLGRSSWGRLAILRSSTSGSAFTSKGTAGEGKHSVR